MGASVGAPVVLPRWGQRYGCLGGGTGGMVRKGSQWCSQCRFGMRGVCTHGYMYTRGGVYM